MTINNLQNPFQICRSLQCSNVGRDSVVGKANRYGLDDRGSNTGGGEMIRTRPHRPCGSPSVLHSRYHVSFRVVMRPGRGFNHPLTPSTKVKERVDVYLYSPSESSWRTLDLPYIILMQCEWQHGH